MINAILIDPDALRTGQEPIRTVEVSGGLADIYKQLSYDGEDRRPCSCVSVVELGMKGDGIYVDDEALSGDPIDFIVLEGIGTPMTGKGLVVGCSREGDDISPQSTTETWLRGRARLIVDGNVHRHQDGAWASIPVRRYGAADSEIFTRLVRGHAPDPERAPVYSPTSPDPVHIQRFARIVDSIHPDIEATYPALEALVREHVTEAVRQFYTHESDAIVRSALVTEYLLKFDPPGAEETNIHAMTDAAKDLAADLGIAPKIRILIELGCDDAPILACFEPDSPEPM